MEWSVFWTLLLQGAILAIPVVVVVYLLVSVILTPYHSGVERIMRAKAKAYQRPVSIYSTPEDEE